MARASPLLFVLFFVGCISLQGGDVLPDWSRVKEGATTREEILRDFGPPEKAEPCGAETCYIYRYQRQVRPMSPVVAEPNLMKESIRSVEVLVTVRFAAENGRVLSVLREERKP